MAGCLHGKRETLGLGFFFQPCSIKSDRDFAVLMSDLKLNSQYVSATSFIFINMKDADIFLFNFKKECVILRAKFH